MPKAIRYRSGGKYLQNTLFWTAGDFIGAGHADPVLAAIEESMTIASHKVDLGGAFGIDPAMIDVVVVPYNGDPETLPKEDEPDNLVKIVELPLSVTPPAPSITEEIAALKAQIAQLVAERRQ